MNAEEKAKELVERFYEEIATSFNNDYFMNQSKKCALIAVDEILTSKEAAYPGYIEVGQIYRGYWQQVKEEIERL